MSACDRISRTVYQWSSEFPLIVIPMTLVVFFTVFNSNWYYYFEQEHAIIFCPLELWFSYFESLGWEALLWYSRSWKKTDSFYPIMGGPGRTLLSVNFVVTNNTPPSTSMHRNTLNLSCFASIALLSVKFWDKRNSRGIIGKNLPRKTNKDRPFDSNCRCDVFLNDSFGFYLLGDAGCAQHKMHPKLPPSIVPVTSKNVDSIVCCCYDR